MKYTNKYICNTINNFSCIDSEKNNNSSDPFQIETVGPFKESQKAIFYLKFRNCYNWQLFSISKLPLIRGALKEVLYND